MFPFDRIFYRYRSCHSPCSRSVLWRISCDPLPVAGWNLRRLCGPWLQESPPSADSPWEATPAIGVWGQASSVPSAAASVRGSILLFGSHLLRCWISIWPILASSHNLTFSSYPFQSQYSPRRWLSWKSRIENSVFQISALMVYLAVHRKTLYLALPLPRTPDRGVS